MPGGRGGWRSPVDRRSPVDDTSEFRARDVDAGSARHGRHAGGSRASDHWVCGPGGGDPACRRGGARLVASTRRSRGWDGGRRRPGGHEGRAVVAECTGAPAGAGQLAAPALRPSQPESCRSIFGNDARWRRRRCCRRRPPTPAVAPDGSAVDRRIYHPERARDGVRARDARRDYVRDGRRDGGWPPARSLTHRRQSSNPVEPPVPPVRDSGEGQRRRSSGDRRRTGDRLAPAVRRAGGQDATGRNRGIAARLRVGGEAPEGERRTRQREATMKRGRMAVLFGMGLFWRRHRGRAACAEVCGWILPSADRPRRPPTDSRCRSRQELSSSKG